MELIWKELEAERLISRNKVQVRISEDLPSPDGRQPSVILDNTTRVKIENASVSDGEILLSGEIEAIITSVDTDGKTFAFISNADFSHVIKADCALSGMSVKTDPVIQNVTASPSPGGARLDANVDIEYLLISAVPMRIIGGVSGVEDLEMKTDKAADHTLKTVGEETLRLREEIAAEGISEVISTSGVICVRNVAPENGGATVSGLITVSAVVSDVNGHIGQLVRQIPFRERLAVSAVCDTLYCRAELDSVYLRSLGEEFSLLAMDAQTHFTLFAPEEKQLVIPVDAFSPTIGFGCLRDRIEVLNTLRIETVQTVFKETIELPEGAPDIGTPLFASSRMIITESSVCDKEESVKGVISATVVYESETGIINTFTEEIPFEYESEIPEDADDLIVNAECVADIAGASERSIQIQFTAALDSTQIRTDTAEVLTGLAEMEQREKLQGLVVCFASEGESVFDIAKRYSVSCASVRKLNPDIEEPCREGDKLILLV